MNPSVSYVVAALHSLVREKSSVPKVADKIGMNYYSLRDNLLGNSEIRLSTFYSVIDAIGVSEEAVKTRAAQLESEARAGQ